MTDQSTSPKDDAELVVIQNILDAMRDLSIEQKRSVIFYCNGRLQGEQAKDFLIVGQPPKFGRIAS